MAGTRRHRKPLGSYEFGTRIYAPSEGEDRYRIVTTDGDGRRVFQKVADEETARRRARQLEKMLASSVTMPGPLQAPTTVGGLIDRYVARLGSRSTRYAERQEYLLREWSDRVAKEEGSEALLFSAADGGFANRRTFQRMWARAARAAGWPMKRPTSALWHPHDLRHVAACWLLFDVGLDPAVVGTLLGHANPAFTLSRYVGVRGDLSTTVTAATEGW